ncbi:MAG: gamma-glutamyl-gamma-aminobutyrate hydrolase family protein, partial [Deltaproteobacteria bacterium]|nr:gamma-glutamyl-gamma-aminobutyrate hydrolase family protein [Deltaproteobacteria bacterium]
MMPIIGLTSYGYLEQHTVSAYYDYHYAVPKEYIDSVKRAGGVPLLIPANGNDWETLWPVMDGIIVTGGTDVSPAHYQGNINNNHVQAIDVERDITEIKLMRRAVALKDIPMLCICRGMQVLNVALGGTLHAHIPDIRDIDLHRGPDGGWTLHECIVQPDSRLIHIMGAERVSTFSGHHQAVDRIAEGLDIAATAPDGIVEALVAPEHPW